MGFSTATLTHTFTNPDDSPARGRVQFSLTKGMTNGTTTIIPISVIADLDATGALSQTLTSNLDSATNPLDSQWRVDLRLAGLPPLTYFIQVPTGGGTIDLGALLPTEGTTVPIEVTPLWQSYLDMDLDVKPYLQITPGNTKYDASLNDITAHACEWVQQHLGRPVAPTQFFRRFDGWTGWQGSYIDLPYYPVLGTPTVVEYRGLSGAFTLTEQTPEQQANTSGGLTGDVYQIDRLAGLIIRTLPGLIPRPFFPGQKNVEISWTAGYNPVPQQIRTATLELCDHLYRNTQEAVRDATASSPYDEAMPQAWPAVPNRVTQMLQSFTQIGIG